MAATAKGDAAMLRGVGAVATTSDPQISAHLENDFKEFNQWKTSRDVNRRSKLMRLRTTLDHLLTRLLGARDYAGAAQVLSVLYHRFTLIPARCVQSSLEILRRHPQHHKEQLMQFFQTALRNGRLDQVMVFKEMLMLHIVSGDYYEAYHLFKDEMQELDVHHDPHLQGTFGMVCYWMLFIESEELRAKLCEERDYESISDDDENGGNEWSTFMRPHRSQNRSARMTPSAVELVETRYRYKTAIGVHILYQEAVTALRRAIAVSPQSTVFVEFYVQLLTLAGDTARACDLLEHFYYLNPADPHAARLLANYLEAHFPESSEARVDIYSRWMQRDPSSSEALGKLEELSGIGLLSREKLLLLLARALDVLGGDIHLAQYTEPAVRLWRSISDCVQACACPENQSDSTAAAMADIRSSRTWWLKSYLSRPATTEQAIACISRSEAFSEVVILKAVVAYHLFKEDGLVIGRAVHTLDLTDPSALNSVDMKKFRRVFPLEIATKLFLPLPKATMTTIHEKQPAPSHPGVTVLSRSLLVKDTTHATPSSVQVARTEHEDIIVDQELVRALEEAIRVELADGQVYRRQGKRLFETTTGGLFSSNGETTVSVPLYVDLIEELLHKRVKISAPHMQVQLKGYLRDAGAIIPSWLEVREAFQYFQERRISNEARYGHPGLLHRYEAFLVRYLRKRAKSTQYWIGGVSPTDVHDALQEMRLHVSRSHIHFPEYDETAKWMQIKASRFFRFRRRLLRDYMLAMRFVAYESDHVETRDLVYAAMRVAAQNHHSDLLAVEDLQRQAKIVLVNRYAFVVRHMRATYRQFFEDYVRVGSVYDPVEVLAALKRRFIRMKSMPLGDVKAFLWLKRWEAENPGRYRELIEDKELTSQ